MNKFNKRKLFSIIKYDLNTYLLTTGLLITIFLLFVFPALFTYAINFNQDILEAPIDFEMNNINFMVTIDNINSTFFIYSIVSFIFVKYIFLDRVQSQLYLVEESLVGSKFVFYFTKQLTLIILSILFALISFVFTNILYLLFFETSFTFEITFFFLSLFFTFTTIYIFSQLYILLNYFFKIIPSFFIVIVSMLFLSFINSDNLQNIKFYLYFSSKYDMENIDFNTYNTFIMFSILIIITLVLLNYYLLIKYKKSKKIQS